MFLRNMSMLPNIVFELEFLYNEVFQDTYFARKLVNTFCFAVY